MILDLLFTTGFLFLSLIFLKIGGKEGFDFGAIFLGLLFLFIGLLPLFLFLDYLIFSFSRKVIIDEKAGIVQIENYPGFRTEKIKNIKSVEIYELVNSRLIPFSFSYAKYFLANGQFFIVTSFMTNSYYVPNGQKPQIIETIFPKINTKTKQPIKVKSEKEIYMEKYEGYADKELNEIVNPKNGYRQNAVEAANELIEKRKNGV